MSESVASRLRYTIHGLNVAISSSVQSSVVEAIDQAMSPFTVRALPTKPSPLSGILRPFEQQEVLRYLSPTATRISPENDLIELYEEGERFWLIDDHWGLCEINVLKGQWRSWILQEPIADPQRIVEKAVLWPTAQLMRARGLCLIPAAAVVRDGCGTLILSNFGIEPELSTLVRAGYRIIGQSWVALREEEGRRIVMLNMPGSLERATPKSPSNGTISAPSTTRVDLTSEFCGSRCEQAVCDSVLLVTSGRRPLPGIRQISSANAVGALRYAWPMTELHPHRRHGQLPNRIAQRCKVFETQLSRNPADVLTLLDAIRTDRSLAAPIGSGNPNGFRPTTKVA